MNLTELGIAPDDEILYRHLLKAGATDMATLAACTSSSLGEIESAVERLMTMGLATLDDQGTVIASPFQQSLERLAHRRIEEILSDLQRVFAAKAGLETGEGLPERIDGEETVNDRIREELWLRPAEEVRSVKGPRPVRVPRLGDIPHQGTLFRLRQGVRYRTIVHRTQLDLPEGAVYYREMDAAGDRCRVTNDHIQPMKLLDRNRAFVPIRVGEVGAGAFLLRDPGTVSTLVDLFDRAWDGAVDITRWICGPPSDLDRQIFCVLRHAPKDEVAARQLDMSVRTFRRHVSELMSRTGAANRFQLAVIAKEQGWI